ncbi:hypothetical protein L7F22_062029 [Adiantum nelumboides]|nr:hypothetical protein [Adiantum nelumboides]
MDSGQYIPPPARWDNNSDLASFGAARDPDHRLGGSFGGRGFQELNYSGDSVYSRDQYRRDREGFAAPPPVMGLLPPARRNVVEDEYAMLRGGPRHEKVGYGDAARDVDRYRDLDNLRDVDRFRDFNRYHSDGYHEDNGFRDYELQRRGGFPDRYEADKYDARARAPVGSTREGNRGLDYAYLDGSDYERQRHKDGGWEKHREKPMDRSLDRGRYKARHHSFSRSRSRSRSVSRSRSHSRSRSFSRSHSYDGGPERSRSPLSHRRSRRDDSGDEDYHESSWRRDRDDRRYHDRSRVAPSATLVVKGLSHSTVEDDLYKALIEWGPLRHVRVIKERNSGNSRGFAFIDFPSVDAAKKAMDGLREDGLVLDGRRAYFEYSSKPTGGVGAPQAQLTPGVAKHGISAVDWMCTVCGCVNFARRMLCFQCNEVRSDDSPAADMSLSIAANNGRKSAEAGPTHILVVRGLDEHVNEDMLHTEFSKYAPLKDLRLVRDKFTHVSRGFAFVHFHSVDEAAAALEATNNTALEKNGQLLRVAFAKSGGPGSSFHASSIAAAAIEAATFAQQYDFAGRISKDSTGIEKTIGAPQSGYVWDEASGYYYDAASGYYYDPHRCLFYDGNHGLWYSYDEKSRQYVPYVEPSTGAAIDSREGKKRGSTDAATQEKNETSTVEEGEVDPNASNEEDKKPSLAEAVQAAALAAQAAAKKEKEKMKEKEKEIRLAMKGSLLASKKKLLTLWKQRQNEGQAATPTPIFSISTSAPARELSPYQSAAPVLGTAPSQPYGTSKKSEVTTSSITRMATGNALEERQSTSSTTVRRVEAAASQSASLEVNTGSTPYKTDASALGSYAPVAGSKRRFTEAPQPTQPIYRDRAAERRSLYGSSSSTHDDLLLEMEMMDKGAGGREWGSDMPFPPGVGSKGSIPTTEAALGGPESQAFEVITAETAIDQRNVGNRMLRSMGWQEGSGLGKDGTGIVEPVQATSMDVRAGLGSQGQQRKVDARFETQPGDSYRIVIQKKALARFQQAMGNPALQGEVQQQLHAYGILPPFQQERGPEKSHDEISKKGLSTKKGVQNLYQELKQLLEGKPSSKKKAHAPHEGSPSKEREGSESQDESMKDVASRRRRAQRSPTPPKQKRFPHSPHHCESKREENSSMKKKERKRSPFSPSSSPSSSSDESSGYFSQEKQRRGHQRSYVA